MTFIIDLAQQLQDSRFGTALAESRYAFPALEGFHLIGLSLSVGLIAIIDLRMVGLILRRVPAVQVLQQLRRWVLGGFALTFLSGSVLLTSEAATVIQSPAFPLKFLFIFLAGLNALYFELTLRQRLKATAAHVSPGTGGDASTAEGGYSLLLRRAGWASLALWVLVIASGRLIPYIPHY